MSRKSLNEKFHLNISASHWQRACKHVKKYGHGQNLPKPQQPKSKQVCIYFILNLNLINK